VKKLSLIILGILAIAQFAVPFSMIRSRENILRHGEVFKFKTRPIDPADPFQGRYVRLAVAMDFIPTPVDEKPGLRRREPVYALLEVDVDGFARFTGWQRERPAQGAFLKTRYLGEKNHWIPETRQRICDGIRINIPFERFYMDEAAAPRAERRAREATRTTNCWAEVRILDGTAALEDVIAEGQSLRMLAREKE